MIEEERVPWPKNQRKLWFCQWVLRQILLLCKWRFFSVLGMMARFCVEKDIIFRV